MSFLLDDHVKFEVHQLIPVDHRSADVQRLAYREQAPRRSSVVVPVGQQDETVWVAMNEQTHRLEPATAGQPAVAGFRVVPRPINSVLAMISRAEGVFVDSLPALPLSILTPKSSVVLGPGCRCFVTKRVTPYIGPPTDDMVRTGLKCTFCGIPMTADPDPETGLVTRVIVHECGAVYHFETSDTHPGMPASDLLGCRDKVRNCLACPRVINEEPYLVWNPSADSRLVRN